MHHRLRTSCVLLPSLNGITILIALKAPAPLRRLVPSVIFGRTYATVSTAASLQRSAIGPGAPLATRRLIQMRNIYKWTVDTRPLFSIFGHVKRTSRPRRACGQALRNVLHRCTLDPSTYQSVAAASTSCARRDTTVADGPYINNRTGRWIGSPSQDGCGADGQIVTSCKDGQTALHAHMIIDTIAMR